MMPKIQRSRPPLCSLLNTLQSLATAAAGWRRASNACFQGVPVPGLSVPHARRTIRGRSGRGSKCSSIRRVRHVAIMENSAHRGIPVARVGSRTPKAKGARAGRGRGQVELPDGDGKDAVGACAAPATAST